MKTEQRQQRLDEFPQLKITQRTIGGFTNGN